MVSELTFLWVRRGIGPIDAGRASVARAGSAAKGRASRGSIRLRYESMREDQAGTARVPADAFSRAPGGV